MNISLKNVGILTKANVDFNGIAVIGGYNDTGKSTVSKVAYAIIRACTPKDDEVLDEKESNVDDIIRNLLRIKYTYSPYKEQQEQLEQLDFTFDNEDDEEDEDEIFNIDEIIQDLSRLPLDDKDRETFNSLSTEYDSWEKEDIKDKVIEKRINRYLNYEFRGGLSNKFNNEKTEINFIVSSSDKISIFDIEKKLSFHRENFPTIFDDVIYINTPFALNNISRPLRVCRTNGSYLNFMVRDEKKEVQDTFISSYKKIEADILDIIHGQMKIGEMGKITFGKNDKNFALDNTATGIKMFGILQLLLENRNINATTLLILDEPEVHLHTGWQVKLAKILVLIAKELNVPMLITTHSGFMVEALNLYSKQEDFSDRVKYYLSDYTDDTCTQSEIKICPPYEISKSLAKPFETLRDVKLDLEEKGKL